MIKQIKKRFIKYNMLVISSSILILAIAITLGGNSSISLHRWIVTGSLAILIVYISSLIISTIAIAPIKEAWQRQLDFTADASHELRTPLAVIQANLELVMDNPEETVAEQTRWLKNSLEEALRMNKIVNDLLVLSRADTEGSSISTEHIDLSSLVNIALESFTSTADKKDITLRGSIEENIQMNGNPDRLMQLIIILVDNAMKYMTPPGSIDVQLTSSVKEITIRVSDTGDGIAEEDQEHIFDRFYRVDKARSHTDGGTGLGLSIAQWIVNSHHGKIEVNSTIGYGTEFIIRFPLK